MAVAAVNGRRLARIAALTFALGLVVPLLVFAAMHYWNARPLAFDRAVWDGGWISIDSEWLLLALNETDHVSRD